MQALLLLLPRAMVAPPATPLPSLARLSNALTSSPPTTIIMPSLFHRRDMPSSLAGFAAHLASPLQAQKCDTSKGAVPASASAFASPFPSPDEESERAKLAQVSKRLENTSRYFKRLGSLGFWGQLVCTIVAAVILSFSAVVTGKITSPVTFYATAGGIAAAFVSVFWSFGYIRLSERLRRTASLPAKVTLSKNSSRIGFPSDFIIFYLLGVLYQLAPPRAEVVKSLKNGIVVNLLGMGAAVLGMQATVGFLVAKALTSSVIPYYQGISAGQGPVLALDVFLVQASANTILSHFLGLVFSLELLRSVTLPHVESVPAPKAA